MGSDTAVAPAFQPCTVFGGLDDATWFDVLVQSLARSTVKGVTLPGFPPAEFQVGSVGSAGKDTLREAFRFWKALNKYAGKWHAGERKNRRVLDFGCGWGRTMRFFLKDLPGENVWGLDAAHDMIALCKRHFQLCHFELVTPIPPTALPSASFDIAYSYSVFTHLNEAVANAWIAELARLLKPGGLLVLTVEPRSFIKQCERFRRRGGTQNAWEESLSRLFVDQRATLDAYDRGEFLHVPTGGGAELPATFYGESVIPRAYIEQHWTESLELVAFRDKSWSLPQALVVMRKPMNGG